MLMLDDYMLDFLDEDDTDWTCLTEWEREFLTSIRLQVERNDGEVSEKQFDILTRIIEKVENEGDL